MPGYENARSTVLLATRCLCCSRPLRDATSVEVGIGPVCRERYGFNDAISEENRVAANALVHEAALDATTDERRLEIAAEIEGMGLVRLAEKIRDRFMGDMITVEKAEISFNRNEPMNLLPALVVRTPYDAEKVARFKEVLKANTDWRDRRPVYVRRGGSLDGEVFAGGGAGRSFYGWAVKVSGRFADRSKRGLWESLKAVYAGESLRVGERTLLIPAAPAA